mmetsp:Transcript_11891/g.31849  ORF Transcript_11891/g.31849 Transcript_11891/m.31849 type:complete len:312 (-) Transcript_11891:451-1386(-)
MGASPTATYQKRRQLLLVDTAPSAASFCHRLHPCFEDCYGAEIAHGMDDPGVEDRLWVVQGNLQIGDTAGHPRLGIIVHRDVHVQIQEVKAQLQDLEHDTRLHGSGGHVRCVPGLLECTWLGRRGQRQHRREQTLHPFAPHIAQRLLVRGPNDDVQVRPASVAEPILDQLLKFGRAVRDGEDQQVVARVASQQTSDVLVRIGHAIAVHALRGGAPQLKPRLSLQRWPDGAAHGVYRQVVGDQAADLSSVPARAPLGDRGATADIRTHSAAASLAPTRATQWKVSHPIAAPLHTAWLHPLPCTSGCKRTAGC